MQLTAIPGFQSELRAEPWRTNTAQHLGQTAEDNVAIETPAAATAFRTFTCRMMGRPTSFWKTGLNSQQRVCTFPLRAWWLGMGRYFPAAFAMPGREFVIVGSFEAIDRPHSHTLFKSIIKWFNVFRCFPIRVWEQGWGSGDGRASKTFLISSFIREEKELLVLIRMEMIPFLHREQDQFII